MSKTMILVNCSHSINILYSIVNKIAKAKKKIQLIYFFFKTQNIADRRVEQLESIESYFSEFESLCDKYKTVLINFLIEVISKNVWKYNWNFSPSCTSHDMKHFHTNSVSRRNLNSRRPEVLYNRRLTALGCQNGWLGVFLIDTIKNGKITQSIADEFHNWLVNLQTYL